MCNFVLQLSFIIPYPRPMNSWRVLVVSLSDWEQKHVWMVVYIVRYPCPSLSDVGPFWCQILVELNFMKILSAFLVLLAFRRTDRQTSGKHLKFLVANALSSKQCDKNSRFFVVVIVLTPFSFLSLWMIR